MDSGCQRKKGHQKPEIRPKASINLAPIDSRSCLKTNICPIRRDDRSRKIRRENLKRRI